MAQTVFILGAGASAEAGVPVMATFLDTARELYALGRVHQAKAQFDAVFDAINALQAVHSKARLDIHNVEAVFTAFEMAATLRHFPGYAPEGIDELNSAMRRVIAWTVAEKLTLSMDTEGFVRPPYPYAEFVALISNIRKHAQPKQTVAVLTFNYDMAFEWAAVQEPIEIDYGLSNERRGMPFLKLHGSINWLRCEKEGCRTTVVPRGLDSLGSLLRSWKIGDKYRVPASAWNEGFCCPECNSPFDPDPVVVPPTWNKADHHREIAAVWTRAAEELHEAERIYVIGYSLPETDSFFRYLYALGCCGPHIFRTFTVCNLDVARLGIEKRFRDLLGPGAEERFRYFTGPFSKVIGSIKTDFFGNRDPALSVTQI